MGFPPSKTVYASAVQLIPMAESSAPYETMLDYNITYLDGFCDLRDWAMMYYKAGKGNLKGYANIIKKLIKEGKNPFNNYITVNPEDSYELDEGLVKDILLDLGYSMDNIEKYSIDVLNPNYDETAWIKTQLAGYDIESDTITIDNVVYTIKEYWFDNYSTIRVYLADADGNILQKTVPAYGMLDTSSESIVARRYLYLEYTVKGDATTHVYVSPIPASGTTDSYVYTCKDGTTYDYTKIADKTTAVLPMMPLKVGGDGMGWDADGSIIAEKRNLPKNSKFRNPTKLIADQKKRIENKKKQLEKETDEKKKENIQKTIEKYEEQLKDYEDYVAKGASVDLTGIEEDPHKAIKDYYSDSSETSKLYKKAEWYDKCDNYDIYKKCCKKCGTTLESQMCTIYDALCGFNDQDTDTLREQLYDCYFGFGCPMTALKTTNVYTQPNSQYDSIIKRLKADTRHPEVAAYATYTRYTDDEIFETDRDDDGDYEHNHFAEINTKKYKPMGVKAIACYCFNYFNLYSGTSMGKKITVRQIQGNYYATHTWKQYRKTTHAGQYKYRYGYEFSAARASVMVFTDVEYTGKMQCTGINVTTGKRQYKPIYAVKKYQIQADSSFETDTTGSKVLSGIPIYTKFYSMELPESADTSFIGGLKPKYEKTEYTGIVTYQNPMEKLTVSEKRLMKLEETTTILLFNITFANATVGTIGTYVTNRDQITTVAIGSNIGSIDPGYDLTSDVLPDYTAEDLALEADTDDDLGAIVTGMDYSPFTKSLFPEKGHTYIFNEDDDYYEGETITLKYFHNINAFQYEEIKVKDYEIEWRVNLHEGGQKKAASLSCIAPDGNSFLPIVVDIVSKKLSFEHALIVYNYSMKGYWSYWVKKKVKVSFLNFVISIVMTGGIALFAAAISSNLYFQVMKVYGTVADLIGIHGLLKIFGLDDTIFGIVIEFIVDLVITVLTAGAYLVVMVALALVNLSLNLYKYVIGRNQQDAVEDFKDKMQIAKDKQLELSNLNQMMSGGGLTLESIVKRVHRFASMINPTNIMKMFELPDTSCSNIIDAMVNLPANIPTRSQLYGA